MSTRRIIPITLDAETSARKVVVGTALSDPDRNQQQKLYYGTQCLFRATLLSGAVSTAFSPAADAAWLFGIDSVFTADKPDLVISDNDQFNITGDWDDLNPTAGKITWRADFATQELKAALALLPASTQSQTMYAYLWMLPAGGGNVLIATWEVKVFRIAVDPVTAGNVTPIGFVTPAQANASYVPIWGDQARWRWSDGGWQYLFEEDTQWRALAPRIIDGHPTIAWSDPI